MWVVVACGRGWREGHDWASGVGCWVWSGSWADADADADAECLWELRKPDRVGARVFGITRSAVSCRTGTVAELDWDENLKMPRIGVTVR